MSGDRVAAELAGVSKEAARTTRLLGLGGWHAIAVESPDGHLFLAPPTADTVLLAVAGAVPADGAARPARRAGRARGARAGWRRRR